MSEAFLTEDEHEVVTLLGKAASIFAQKVLGPVSGVREADLNEFVAAVHVCQRMVLSNAAARLYPGSYRLIGGGGAEAKAVKTVIGLRDGTETLT